MSSKLLCGFRSESALSSLILECFYEYPATFRSTAQSVMFCDNRIELVSRRTANSLNNEHRRNDKLDEQNDLRYVRIKMHQTMKWPIMIQCLEMKNEIMSIVYYP